MTTADVEANDGSRAANSSPPNGDTGATSPSWAIDWLAVTVWGVDVDRVARLVSEAFHLGKQAGIGEWQARKVDELPALGSQLDQADGRAHGGVLEDVERLGGERRHDEPRRQRRAACHARHGGG